MAQSNDSYVPRNFNKTNGRRPNHNVKRYKPLFGKLASQQAARHFNDTLYVEERELQKVVHDLMRQVGHLSDRASILRAEGRPRDDEEVLSLYDKKVERMREILNLAPHLVTISEDSERSDLLVFKVPGEGCRHLPKSREAELMTLS